MVSRRALGALAGIGASALAARSLAQPSTAPARAVAIRWTAPPECPDEAYVDAEIARLLEGSDAPPHALDATAEVAHNVNGAWRVRVVTRGDRGLGERTLDAASCRALADATALIVALAVDPARVAVNQVAAPTPAGAAPIAAPEATAADAGAPDARASNASTTPVASSPPPRPAPADAGAPSDAAAGPLALPAPRTPSAPAPASTSAAPPLVRTSFLATAAGAVDVGSLPFAGLGPSIVFAWTPPSLRLDASLAYFPLNHTRALPHGGTAAFTLVAADARACWAALDGAVVLGPCAGLGLARLAGSSRGVIAPSSGATVYGAFDADVVVGWRFAPSWQLDLRGGAQIPWIRPDFRIDADTVHTPGAVVGRASLAVGYRF